MSLAIFRNLNLLYLKISKTVLTLGLNRVYNIRKTNCKPLEYRFYCISKSILSIYQMAAILMKSIGKYVKSFIFIFRRDIWL